MKIFGSMILGILIGSLATAFIAWNAMPGMMINVSESKLPFEETVSAIEEAASENGWQVPKVYDIQASLNKAGHDDMTSLKIISMCQPDHAYDILSSDDRKRVAAMMPCRVGVYQANDGKTYLTQLNIGLMSKMFGGKIAEVMQKVEIEQQGMLTGLIK